MKRRVVSAAQKAHASSRKKAKRAAAKHRAARQQCRERAEDRRVLQTAADQAGLIGALSALAAGSPAQRRLAKKINDLSLDEMQAILNEERMAWTGHQL